MTAQSPRRVALLVGGMLSVFALVAAPMSTHGHPVPGDAGADRSPSDLAISGEGTWSISANETSRSVSLIDLRSGRVVDEAPLGFRPTSVAMSADGRRAVAVGPEEGKLAVFDVADKLRLRTAFDVGSGPRGVALTKDGTRAYVVLSHAGDVVAVDLRPVTTGQPAVLGTPVHVGRSPWFVALSPDEKTLAVGNTQSRDVAIMSAPDLKVHRSVRLAGNSGDNPRQLCFSPDGKWVYLTHVITRGFPTTRANIDNGWVVASRATRVPIGESAGPRESLALDPRGQAVGDPHGTAVSPDGQWMAISAPGTHELLLYRLPLPFVAYGGPGDHIEPDLLKPDGRFRRVALGGRPMGIRFSPDSRAVYVANYLSNSIQEVDVASASLRRSVALGGPADATSSRVAARRGEALFYDARRSHNQWFSCGSCHVEGHTNRQLYDTKNDGQYGNAAKIVPSLRNVTRTGPWTWHGWQESLPASVLHSFETSMSGPRPTETEVADLVAFLDTLNEPRNPTVRNPTDATTAAVRRGEKLFTGKAACAGCHSGRLYTSGQNYDVGLGATSDIHKGFNPPSLLGVHDRAPYLHDGRAENLEELLTRDHRPERLGAREPLTPSEQADLIVFLNSL